QCCARGELPALVALRLVPEGLKQGVQACAALDVWIDRQHRRRADEFQQLGRGRHRQRFQRRLRGGDDMTVDVAAEVKAMDRARWHDDQAWRFDCPRPAVDERLAAPCGDVEHLDQRVMDMRLDVEVETAGTQGNAFVMDHVDPGWVGFRAIEREMQDGPAALQVIGHDARYVLLYEISVHCSIGAWGVQWRYGFQQTKS